MEYWPAQDKYVEYLYLAGKLVASRRVINASQTDSDGDGIKDTVEFR
jgi:hypothetical protein